MDTNSGAFTRFHRHILWVWVIAILWIFLGNIINFHQHHIWGKQLIPIACSTTRAKEKSIVKLSGTSLHPYAASGISALSSENCTLSCIIDYGNIAAIHYFYSDLLLLSCTLFSSPLRGPPIV
jgi:hypothetical protein